MLRLSRTTTENPDFRALVVLLDKYLAELDGDEHAFYAQLNQLVKVTPAVVAYSDDKPVGCGAFRDFSPGEVEIKRMFVLPEYRGQGIAQAVLTELERWAQEQGNAAYMLETGKRQPEAIRLYEKSGYALTPSYGQYLDVENSVCMRKEVVGTSPHSGQE